MHRKIKNLKQSEIPFREVVEGMSDITLATDTEGRFIYMSPSVTNHLGYTPSELIGKFSRDFTHPDDYSKARKRALDMVHEELPVTEYRIRAKEGGYRWFKSFSKLLHKDNKVIGRYGVLNDITDSKNVEIKLRESEQQFRTIFEQAAVGVALSDSKTGAFLMVNQKYADIVGYSIEELLQMSFTEISHPEDLNEDLYNLRRLSNGEIESFAMDKRFIHKDGSVIWGKITVSPMWRENNKLVHHIAIMEDITERKVLEKELADKNALLEAIINQSPFPMAVVSASDHRILYGNSAVIELLGMDDEDYVGRKYTELPLPYKLYLPDGTELPKNEYPMFKALNQKSSIKQELIVERKDGTRRWYYVIAIPIYSDTGTHLAAFTVFPDITKQKQSEDAIRESEKRYRSIMEASPDPIVTYDMQGNALYVNPAFTRVFGWNYDEVVGSKIDYVPEEAWPETEVMLERSKRGEGFLGFQTQRYDKNRNIIDIEMSFGVWADKSGIPAGSVVILRDVTQQKRLEDKLRQAQKMESLGTLAGGIAHDFNNILSGIFGYAQLLQIKMPKEQKLREYVDSILQAGNRAKDLVKQILTFSRQTENELRPVEIQSIIKEALKLLESTLPSTIQIRQKIQNDCGLVNANQTQIHQIIVNLCTNAYHAMEDIGGELSIHLSEVEYLDSDVNNMPIEPGKYALLQVKDTGVGISKQLQTQIFEPYFTTKEEGKGTGMGLAVVHGIVNSHGGFIAVESEKDKGTEFQIHFPLIAEVQDENHSIVDKTLILGKGHILLLDDQEDVLDIEQQMIEALGYQVTAKFEAMDALDTFKTHFKDFDLVITDLTMPHITGDVFAQELIKIRPDIPIIICTGFSEKMSVKNAEKIGIKGFLMKPLIIEYLSREIQKALKNC